MPWLPGENRANIFALEVDAHTRFYPRVGSASTVAWQITTVGMFQQIHQQWPAERSLAASV